LLLHVILSATEDSGALDSNDGRVRAHTEQVKVILDDCLTILELLKNLETLIILVPSQNVDKDERPETNEESGQLARVCAIAQEEVILHRECCCVEPHINLDGDLVEVQP
jgi:hypothetical protein